VLLNAKFASIAGRSRVHGMILPIAGSAALRDAAVLGTGAASQVIVFLAASFFCGSTSRPRLVSIPFAYRAARDIRRLEDRTPDRCRLGAVSEGMGA
jgi:hypothetical protein